MSAYISEEKLFFNKKDSVNVNSKPFGSKISDFSEIEEFDQETLIVTSQEAKDDSKVAPRDIVATSTNVSKKALTMGDILSMEDSQIPPNKNNTHGPEENIVHHDTQLEITEEPEADNFCDDNLLSRKFQDGFREISYCEAESSLAYITYCGPISGSENLSLRSDGNSASSFAFPMPQSEWNNSPVRMGKAEGTQLRVVKAEDTQLQKEKAEETQLRKEKAEETQLQKEKAEETQLRMVIAEERQLRKEKAEERQIRKEKAKKRQLRKEKKGWRHYYSSLLCCRF